MIKAIAVHGDYANGDILKRDIGVDWIDYYPSCKSSNELKVKIFNYLERGDKFSDKNHAICLGFSRGAEWIRQIMEEEINLDDKMIISAVAYEPLALRKVPKGKNLLITNSLGRALWTRLGKKSRDYWLESGANHIIGFGFHIKFTFRLPFIGHAWDQSLNTQIKEFVDSVKDKT